MHGLTYTLLHLKQTINNNYDKNSCLRSLIDRTNQHGPVNVQLRKIAHFPSASLYTHVPFEDNSVLNHHWELYVFCVKFQNEI